MWPFLEAIHDVSSRNISRADDTLAVLTPNDIVMYRTVGGKISEGSLLRPSARQRSLHWLQRHWAISVVSLFIAAGSTLAMLGQLSWQDFGVGMIVPIVLLVVQQAMARSRAIR